MRGFRRWQGDGNASHHRHNCGQHSGARCTCWATCSESHPGGSSCKRHDGASIAEEWLATANAAGISSVDKLSPICTDGQYHHGAVPSRFLKLLCASESDYAKRLKPASVPKRLGPCPSTGNGRRRSTQVRRFRMGQRHRSCHHPSESAVCLRKGTRIIFGCWENSWN